MPKLRYFDHAAAAPCHTEALDAFVRAIQGNWANPSSLHSAAQDAENALAEAREELARTFGCLASEVVFTTSGTESDNLALRGSLRRLKKNSSRRHVLTSAVEHPAVAVTLADLARNEKFDVETLPVSSNGSVDPEVLVRRMRPDTALVSILWGSNEVGTLNPIAQIARICRERGTLLHTDAVQAAAWLPFSFHSLEVDLLSIGGRKMGAPGGGCLLVRKGLELEPILTGGPHEENRRAGTPNVAEAVAMAVAARKSRALMNERTAAIQAMRDLLLQEIPSRLEGVLVTGSRGDRLPNHASFVVEGVEGNALCRQLDLAGFACAPGAACKTGRPGPSGVLLALGFPDALARCGLRISLGWETQEADVAALLETLPRLVERMRRPRT